MASHALASQALYSKGKDSLAKAHELLNDLVEQQEKKLRAGRGRINSNDSSSEVNSSLQLPGRSLAEVLGIPPVSEAQLQDGDGRSTKTGSCENCRKAKAKCVRPSDSTSDRDKCARCVANSGLECVYASLRRAGRRRVGTRASRIASQADAILEVVNECLEGMNTQNSHLHAQLAAMMESTRSNTITKDERACDNLPMVVPLTSTSASIVDTDDSLTQTKINPASTIQMMNAHLDHSRHKRSEFVTPIWQQAVQSPFMLNNVRIAASGTANTRGPLSTLLDNPLVTLASAAAEDGDNISTVEPIGDAGLCGLPSGVTDTGILQQSSQTSNRYTFTEEAGPSRAPSPSPPSYQRAALHQNQHQQLSSGWYSSNRQTQNDEAQRILQSLQQRQERLQSQLYEEYSDVDPAIDPINLAIVSTPQAQALVDFYFENLHPFNFQLFRDLHTVAYLRATSTLLFSTVCAISAIHSPDHRHLAHILKSHVKKLINRVYEEGFRSVAIVEALCMYVGWAGQEEFGVSQRPWTLLGIALRVASAIRLDKESADATVISMTQASALVSLDRLNAWRLLVVAEITLSISTGRSGGLNLSSLPRSISCDGTSTIDPSVMEKLCKQDRQALQTVRAVYNLRLIVSGALDQTLVNDISIDREAFMLQHTSRINDWQREFYSKVDDYSRVLFWHAQVLVCCIALRFPGQDSALFTQCRKAAKELLVLVTAWDEQSIRYASNFFIGNVGYTTVVLCRLLQCEVDQLRLPYIQNMLALCVQVSHKLSAASRGRLYGRSLAADHAENIMKLVRLLSASLRKVTATNDPSANTKVEHATAASSEAIGGQSPYTALDSWLQMLQKDDALYPPSATLPDFTNSGPEGWPASLTDDFSMEIDKLFSKTWDPSLLPDPAWWSA